MAPKDLNPHWFELWSERAAIREFDGGYPREEAERLALADVRSIMRRQAVEVSGPTAARDDSGATRDRGRAH